MQRLSRIRTWPRRVWAWFTALSSPWFLWSLGWPFQIAAWFTGGETRAWLAGIAAGFFFAALAEAGRILLNLRREYKARRRALDDVVRRNEELLRGLEGADLTTRRPRWSGTPWSGERGGE